MHPVTLVVFLAAQGAALRLAPGLAVGRREACAIATSAALSRSLAPTPAAAADVAAARAQWRAAVGAVDAIVRDFDAIPGGGDGVRRRLGTVGTDSPLFLIDRACRALLPEAEDPVAFGEALEEFLLGLGRADSMAYSANFAGGSGNPNDNSAASYLRRSKAEVSALRKDVAAMDRALGGS